MDSLVAAGALGVGFVVWLVRLEGRVNQNGKLIEYEQRRTDLVAAKLEALDNKIMHELASLRESVARIEGYLKKSNEGEN